jgi:hypothetical protein
LQTTEKLIEKKYVLISSEAVMKVIIEYYNTFNLIERGEVRYPFVYGIPVRNSLDQTLNLKLKKIVSFKIIN